MDASGSNLSLSVTGATSIMWETAMNYLDVNVLRGAADGMSDHHWVEAWVKIRRGFGKEEMVRVRRGK